MNRYIIIGSALLGVICRVIVHLTKPWNEMNQTWAILDAFTILFLLVSALVNRHVFYWIALGFCIFILLLSFTPFYGNYYEGYPIKPLMFTRPAILLLALYGIIKSLEKSKMLYSKKSHNNLIYKR